MSIRKKMPLGERVRIIARTGGGSKETYKGMELASISPRVTGMKHRRASGEPGLWGGEPSETARGGKKKKAGVEDEQGD